MGAGPVPSHWAHAQKGPGLCLMVCCSFEILNNFQTKGFCFHFALSPTNSVASTACHVFLAYKVKPDFKIPWNLPHF